MGVLVLWGLWFHIVGVTVNKNSWLVDIKVLKWMKKTYLGSEWCQTLFRPFALSLTVLRGWCHCIIKWHGPKWWVGCCLGHVGIGGGGWHGVRPKWSVLKLFGLCCHHIGGCSGCCGRVGIGGGGWHGVRPKQPVLRSFGLCCHHVGGCGSHCGHVGIGGGGWHGIRPKQPQRVIWA